MGKLILTRKPGESVKIGDSLVLAIREVHPAKVYVQHNDKVEWFKLSDRFALHGIVIVTIAAIRGRQVTLHFEAEDNIKIVRTELLR